MNDILYFILTMGEIGNSQYNMTLYQNSQLLFSIFWMMLLIPFLFMVAYYYWPLGRSSFFAKNSWYFFVIFCSIIIVYFTTYNTIDLFMYEIGFNDTFHISSYKTSAIISTFYSTVFSMIITFIFKKLKVGITNYNIPNFKSSK